MIRDSYAVIGNPIAHSKSPEIHQLFATQQRSTISYERKLLKDEELESFVAEFFAGGGKGLNVTVPFKERIFTIVESLSTRGMLAKAVNTVYLDESNRLCGDNTDGAGIIRDIEKHNDFPIQGCRVLLLGAGGAVRGVLAGFADSSAKPGSIVIANRTLATAQTLASEFTGLLDIEASSYENVGDQYSLIINGTSMGLEGKTPPIAKESVGDHTLCYDMLYSDEETAFVHWALAAGAYKAVDGLGMLVEQAAESYRIWRGFEPDTAEVLRVMRAGLG